MSFLRRITMIKGHIRGHLVSYIIFLIMTNNVYQCLSTVYTIKSIIWSYSTVRLLMNVVLYYFLPICDRVEIINYFSVLQIPKQTCVRYGKIGTCKNRWTDVWIPDMKNDSNLYLFGTVQKRFKILQNKFCFTFVSEQTELNIKQNPLDIWIYPHLKRETFELNL